MIWDLASGLRLRSLTGHRGPVCSLALTPDGRTIISGSGDHTIKVWKA
jgi:WD40 repeat protein